MLFINDDKVHPKSRYHLSPGDSVRVHDAGGGGFYPPWDRDVAGVRADVRDCFVSRTAAKEIYGVSMDPETLEINVKETETLRSDLRRLGDA